MVVAAAALVEVAAAAVAVLAAAAAVAVLAAADNWIVVYMFCVSMGIG